MAPRNQSNRILFRIAAAGVLLAALFGLYWAVRSLPALAEQPPAISAVHEKPVPSAVIPPVPGALDRHSTAGEIHQRISNVAWQTLWVEGELVTFSQDQMPRQQMHQYVQAWFSNDGTRRIIAAREQKYAAAGYRADFFVAYAWLSDGETLSIYNVDSDPPLSHIPVMLLSVRPEIYQPVVLMIDGHLVSYRSDLPQPVHQEYTDGTGNRIETIAGREAVVVDWGSERLWVDTQTGVLLRWQRYTGQPGAVRSTLDMSISTIRIDLPLPENIMDREVLPELQFEAPPGDHSAATPNQ
jgi:outer membrane lipoprotein-sorting protein